MGHPLSSPPAPALPLRFPSTSWRDSAGRFWYHEAPPQVTRDSLSLCPSWVLPQLSPGKTLWQHPASCPVTLTVWGRQGTLTGVPQTPSHPLPSHTQRGAPSADLQCCPKQRWGGGQVLPEVPQPDPTPATRGDGRGGRGAGTLFVPLGGAEGRAASTLSRPGATRRRSASSLPQSGAVQRPASRWQAWPR